MLGVLLHAPRGPFYSPKAARSRWRSIWKAFLSFCWVVHRTAGAPTDNHCSGPVRDLLPYRTQPTVGPRYRLAHRTVWCTPDSLVCQPTIAAGHASPTDCAADRWPRVPLAHRTVRWFIATSPSLFPRAPSWHRASLKHRTLSGAPLNSPVCQARAGVDWPLPTFLQFESSFLGTVSST
jgi:hypothetical protein